MRRLILLFILASSTGLGIYLGLHLHETIRNQRAAARKPEINVLAFQDVLSAEMIREFERELDVRVHLSEAATPEEIWNRIETPPPPKTRGYDLVSLMSYQVPLASQLVRIQPLDLSQLRSAHVVSADLTRLPGLFDIGQRRETEATTALTRFMPVLWGITGLLSHKKADESPPTSWRALREAPEAGLLASSIDIQNLLDAPLPGAVRPVPGEEPGADPTTALRRPIERLLAKASLSNDFLSISSLLQRPRIPDLILANHGETAFPPINGGGWTFKVPDEGGSLWVLAFALTREAQHLEICLRFLDYLNRKESALRMVHNSRQASANKLTEESDLDSRLKPSYLRQIPLTKLKIVTDFSRAREIRLILDSVKAAGAESESRPAPERR